MAGGRAANVSHLLQSLGGVYRDPTRVTRDAQNLLGSTAGTNLRPSVRPLVKNNGESTPPVLVFSGTITMTYKGGNYNIPMDIYLPPPYPVRPPVCFVRPVSSMEIKKNHQHVGSDGMVYMSYLHGWRPHTHNLVELAVSLSSLFGNDPPVFAKPPAAAPEAARPPSVVGRNYATSYQPPPYEDVAARQQEEALAAAAKAKEEADRVAEENRRRLEIEREIEEANQAAAAARAAEEEERLAEERAAELARAEAERKRREEEEERRATLETHEKLTWKLQDHLQRCYTDCREVIQDDLRDQTALERSQTGIERELSLNQTVKDRLLANTESVDDGLTRIKGWLERAEEAAALGESSVDNLAQPMDAQSVQMLQLCAESHAITDCLYFLDRALVKGTVTLDIHLKKVRHLAKRQFLLKAHLMKISQVRAVHGRHSGF